MENEIITNKIPSKNNEPKLTLIQKWVFGLFCFTLVLFTIKFIIYPFFVPKLKTNSIDYSESFIKNQEAISDVYKYTKSESFKNTSKFGLNFDCKTESDNQIIMYKINYSAVSKDLATSCDKDFYSRFDGDFEFKDSGGKFAVFANINMVNLQSRYSLREICISKFASSGILSRSLEIMYLKDSRSKLNNPKYNAVCFA
jgi:hypothetical protein